MYLQAKWCEIELPHPHLSIYSSSSRPNPNQTHSHVFLSLDKLLLMQLWKKTTVLFYSFRIILCVCVPIVTLCTLIPIMLQKHLVDSLLLLFLSIQGLLLLRLLLLHKRESAPVAQQVRAVVQQGAWKHAPGGGSVHGKCAKCEKREDTRGAGR